MDINQVLHNLVFDYTLRTVALGSATLGLVSGVLGAFAVLRRQSLLGDAISHAALPGIALAFLLTGSRAPLVLVVGAAIAGWLGTLAVMVAVRQTRVKQDAALGIVLSVFFGFGMVLLTFIQRRPDASQAGLDRFLFGQAATLVGRDIATMAVLGALVLVAVILLWKEFKLLSFDPGFAASIGYPTGLLDIILTSLIVIAIVIGLQAVGVVLMSAMIVAPAAAARQWTERLSVMVLLSGALGALVGLMGAVTSSVVSRLPTGPTIILYVSLIVTLSLLLAPERGILARLRRRARLRWQFAAEALAVHLLNHEGDPDEANESALSHLRAHMRWDETFARRAVRRAVTHDLVTRSGEHLKLTPLGRETARRAMVR
jgi:manganese/zinc/iron transport system permease protein